MTVNKDIMFVNVGMDPTILLATMLKERGVINDNQLSWIKNSGFLQNSQMEIIEGEDAEERNLMLAVFRTQDFFSARKLQVQRFCCPDCGSEVEERGIVNRNGFAVEMVLQHPFVCVKCGIGFEFQELKEKNKPL